MRVYQAWAQVMIIFMNHFIFFIVCVYCCCSVTKLSPVFFNPTDCSMAGFPVLHYLPEFVQTHVHWVDDAIQSSHLLSWTSPPALNLSQNQGHFLVSQFFASGGQSIGASASVSVLPMNIQGLFPLRLTDLIFLLLKGLSRVISSTIVQKHQFFSAQPFLWPNTHIHTSLLENYSFDYTNLGQQSDVSAF